MRDKLYIADDEKTIRDLLEEAIPLLLPKYQGKISLFDNGRQLEEELKRNSSQVKFILTDYDYNTEGFTGLDLIRNNFRKYPDITFLLMSSDSYLKERAIKDGAKVFIEKPFNLNELKLYL
jgi:DNA-binding NtrC family response regulator